MIDVWRAPKAGSLYLEALRSARRRQLAARALRPINRRRIGASPLPRAFRPLEGPAELWRSAAFSAADKSAERLPDGELEVLGLCVGYPPREWDGAGLERLRRFHLHYGEEILGCARRGNQRYLAAARAGLAAWIDQNPPSTRESWHPYLLSTRIGNWIAASSLEPSLATPEVSESLWRQLAYLERNVEDDILGNHVIRNARALILGGLAFGAGRLLSRGLDLLARELPEQVLPDGGTTSAARSITPSSSAICWRSEPPSKRQSSIRRSSRWSGSPAGSAARTGGPLSSTTAAWTSLPTSELICHSRLPVSRSSRRRAMP